MTARARGRGGHALVSTRHRLRRLARPRAPEAARDDDDARLLARIAAGDSDQALARLYRRYETPLYRLGLRLLRDEGMAEELVQDTLVRLWRDASRYDGTRGSVRSFVFVIAYGAAADLRRRAASRPLDVVPPHDAEAMGPAGPDGEAFDQVVLGIAVAEALEGLTAKHRTVLRMYFEDDLTQPQIAERLQIPLGTVKTRTHHALRALRSELVERAIV